MTEQSLDDLARAASSGEVGALDSLIDALYRERIIRAQIRTVIVADADLAEDAFQEAMASIPTAILNFRGDAKFTTWVATIARRAAMDVLTRERSFLTGDGGDAAFDVERSSQSSYLASRADFEAAVERLPGDYREVIVRREVAQQSYEEIAGALELPINTVRSRLRRARTALMDDLLAPGR